MMGITPRDPLAVAHAMAIAAAEPGRCAGYTPGNCLPGPGCVVTVQCDTTKDQGHAGGVS
jgi:hypothetical protein